MKYVVAAVTALLLAAVVAVIGPALLALLGIGYLAQTSAAANPCTPTGAAVVDAGGPVRLPLTGRYKVTSNFGGRFHPIQHVMKLHAGIDLAGIPSGGPVLAAKAGTVTRLPTGGGGGLMVVIDHGGGLETKYAHLASRSATAGQTVTEGQQIGIEGATGGVTGPHLHWEVVIDGQAVDPRPWAATQGVTIPALGGSGTGPAQGTAGTQNAAVPVALTTPPATAPGAGAGLPAKVGTWNSNQIETAAAIIKAGQDLKLDTWTITVAVMTAMGESSLRSLPYGDTAGPDSRGPFQQRASWGPLLDRMDPYRSAGLFYRSLIKLPGYHDLAPTIAAHRTQRNADPYYYEPFWSQAAQMVTAVAGLTDTTGSTGGTAGCTPAAAAVPAGPADTCPASNSPAETGLKAPALRGLRCTAQQFPQLTHFDGVGTRQGATDHDDGLAVDFMIDTYRTPQGRTLGWQIARWQQAHAKELGIRYLIFDVKIWQASNPSAGWVPYTRYGTNPDDTRGHRDHVHSSFK